MRPRRLISLTAVLALAAASCSTSATAEQEFSETPTAVTITSGTGGVSVTAADSGATVAAEISASGEEPAWSATLVGTELVIDDGCGDRTDCEVDFVITVAGTADVTIDSADGGIAVVDMNSTVTIGGSARTVSLNGITGPISVDLESGDLLAVTSGSGDVTAQVPDGDYDIDASTGSGEVDVKVGDVDGVGSSIVMRTESGDVTIYKR